MHPHKGLWAPLCNGLASTALYGWWDLMVDPDLWPADRGIARGLQALHDAGTGEPVATAEATVRGGALELAWPSIRRDLAAIAFRT